MKFKILNIFLTLTMTFFHNAFAQDKELLVFDKSQKLVKELPLNFRDLSSFGINAIASAQFSEKELEFISKKYPNEKIIIVDLRRESHAIINNNPVSWRMPFEESNINKKSSEIVNDEEKKIDQFSIGQTIEINKVIEKDKDNGWYKETKPETIKVESKNIESNLVKKYGFEYKRFPIRDHATPTKEMFQEMVNFINNLPKDKKVYVHCAAGKGRTTTFLTIYDIIKNGDKLTLEEIIDRQYKIGGSNLKKIDEDEAKWRVDLAKERLEMITKFYLENQKKHKS